MAETSELETSKSTLTKADMKILDSWAQPDPETEFVETGNIGFDMAISNGKGLPLGNSIMFWGAPGCGKTTLFTDIAKRLIQKYKSAGESFKVLYLAIEGSKELMKKMGLREYINSGDFIYIEQRFSWSQIEMLYEAVLGNKGMYKDVRLIIIDSINNVLSDQNLKNSISSGDFGTKARERNNFWSKYLPICKQKKISTFMVAQMRQKQNAGVGMFADTEKAAASFSDLHNADAIFKCKRLTNNQDSVKIETQTAFGVNKTLKRYVLALDPNNAASKNRIDETYQCEVLLEKGKGALNYYVMRKMLLLHGFVKKEGAYYKFMQGLVEGLGLPDKKMYMKDINEIIKEHMSELIAFLKEMNCYSVVTQENMKEIEGTEDSDDSEEVVETYNEDEDEDDDD